jgi:hypothetical protein
MTPPSNVVLWIIVEQEANLARNLNAPDANAAAESGLEPDERDAVFHAIGTHFTGQSSSRCGGMDATRFMANLQDALDGEGMDGRSIGDGLMAESIQ